MVKNYFEFLQHFFFLHFKSLFQINLIINCKYTIWLLHWYMSRPKSPTEMHRIWYYKRNEERYPNWEISCREVRIRTSKAAWHLLPQQNFLHFLTFSFAWATFGSYSNKKKWAELHIDAGVDSVSVILWFTFK